MAGQHVQIVSLGCGLETLWYNLAQEGVKQNFKFIELDLESVVRKKIKQINHSNKIQKLFEKMGIKPVINCKAYIYVIQSITLK